MIHLLSLSLSCTLIGRNNILIYLLKNWRQYIALLGHDIESSLKYVGQISLQDDKT